MRHLLIVSLMCVLPALSPASEGSRMTIERVRHGAWDDCIRLVNGTAELVIAPQAGRVVAYRLVKGPNLLWEQPQAVEYAPKFGGWANWGGEKAWLWPQDLWNWPPPKAIDGSPWSAGVRDGKLILRSGVDEKFGVRIIRQISLADEGTAVTTVTHVEAVRDLDHAVGAWTVTQVAAVPQLLARLEAGADAAKAIKAMMPEPWPAADDVGGGWRMFTMDYASATKVGLRADALAAVLGDSILLQRRIAAATDAEGLDRTEMSQLYRHAAGTDTLPPGHPTYVELEFISASRKLKQGESIGLTVEWSIHPVRRADGRLLPPGE